MHHKLFATGLLTLGFLQSADAQEWPAAQCESCSSQQMQAAARSEIDFGAVAVFSLSTADLKTYVITGNLELHESTPPAALDDYFADLIAVYQANGNSLRVHVDIADLAIIQASSSARSATPAAQAEFPESAWEAINNSAKMNNLLDDMDYRWPALIAGGNSVLRVLNPYTWLKSDGAQVTVELGFGDGSSMEIFYNVKTKRWEEDSNSAKDAHNNSIPRSNDDFAKGGYREYEFNGPPATDLQNFLIEAQRRGIPITGPIGPSFRIGCASANGITTCQAR
ncbi:hypothetical protein ABE493_05000 [Stenotrophomonas terrae]|uniref:hypothetical protein n=1 Tax=Stenotrophomonas terrae TaxID=405446 RepID=UPI00320ABCEF